MKKLLAVLMACAMMTGVFTSCGKDEKEEISESKKDVSVSDSAEEDKTTEPETEEETEGVTTEAETTTEEVTETEEETTESVEEDAETNGEETEINISDGVSDENIINMWLMDLDDVVMGFNFKEDGNADIFMDMTALTHFTSDGKLFMDSETFESDCISYDGTVMAVTVNGQDAFTMTKESGSADSFDGIYTMTSGVIYDSLMTSVDESTEVFVVVIGENLYSGYRNMFKYSANDGIIKMTGLETIGIDEDIESTYEVNGDVVVMHDFDGEEVEMKKLVY
ncbi:MAG: hypothetical protein K2I80_04935 [Ruminococcus sp.]|nr:hypothetical protein [Ruminococcus sp.]MDE6848127.1 hypothetical protein [Ruminococcus sp.]